MSEEQIAAWTAVGLDLALGALKALIILAVGWLLAKWGHRLVLRGLDGKAVDLALVRFLASVAQWVVLGATVIAALGAVGVETGSIIAVFASAGIAVGLALQGSLSNLASGVLLLVFRPFTLEDVVVVGGSPPGRVTEIGLFSTTLVTGDHQKVIVPNSVVTGGTIVNLTAMGTRRADVTVGVAYGADPRRVAQILKAAAGTCAHVLPEPTPDVLFTGLGANAMEFLVMSWGKSADHGLVLHEVRTACVEAIRREGLEIPLPQLVVHRSGEPTSPEPPAAGAAAPPRG